MESTRSALLSFADCVRVLSRETEAGGKNNMKEYSGESFCESGGGGWEEREVDT